MSMIDAIPLLVATGADGGYQISRSVRLRSSASAYFNRAFTTPTSQQKGTFSFWLKRGVLGARNNLFSNDNGTQYGFFEFDANNKLNFADPYSAGACSLITTQVFRDPSAWYHIIIAFDTTQATSTNRAKFYVNGVQITSFDTATYPSQNANLYVLQAASAVQIAAFTRNGTPTLDGYLAEINFVDGQALTPSSFGETNAITGVWQPKKYAGTYGTNGFYLNFSDNSGATATTIGKDNSGNGNNWTPNNISVTAGATYDSMLDVPTPYADGGNGRGNYAVMNPLDKSSGVTVADGNLKASNGAAYQSVRASMTFPASSKIYFEGVVGSATTGGVLIGFGVCTDAAGLNTAMNGGTGYYSMTAVGSGFLISNGTAGSSISGFTAGELIQCAVDTVNGKVWLGRSNVWYNSTAGTNGDPASGANPTFTVDATNMFPVSQTYSNNLNFNFGQRPFTYTPPTGFVALNTQNLPTPTISNGASYMAATTYTGTGSALTIANTVGSASFQPDLVWVKGRSGATDHALYDAVRGVQKQLESNSTGAETTETTGLTAFGSTGFTVGALAQMNTSAATYVAWQWNGGGSTVTNTSGTISAQVRANATAGFSVVTFTSTGSSGAVTVGHGLGVAPAMVITKERGAVGSWGVYHTGLTTPASQYLNLQTTGAATTNTSYWGNTNPTSTVVTLGNGTMMALNTTMVMYCFAAVAGYSAFGRYTGNGSADGPFVFCGFRPRFVMIKRTDSSGFSWGILDTSRNTYNVANLRLFADLSQADNTQDILDILSNGFKLRTTNTNENASGGTYIYMAFAEVPFKSALGR